MSVIIHFEDHGQSFDTWLATDAGVVINSWQGENSVYAGSTIIDLHRLEPGKLLSYFCRSDGKEKKIRYPVEKVVFTNLS